MTIGAAKEYRHHYRTAMAFNTRIDAPDKNNQKIASLPVFYVRSRIAIAAAARMASIRSIAANWCS